MTFDEYLSNPNICLKAKEVAIQFLDGRECAGKRWLQDRFGIKANENKTGNLLQGTKYGGPT